MAVKKPRKTRAKKAPVKRINKFQSNIGKGPNININIDQSKRTKKSGAAPPQQRQQIISTFTPVMGPPPVFNFPLPTNLNPFEAVVKDTQKGKVKEEQPNELEKQKPKQEEEVVIDPNVSFSEDIRRINNPELPFSVDQKRINNPELPFSVDKKRMNNPKRGAPDLSEVVWFNPSRETDTPLENQTRQETPTILTISQPQRQTARGNAMTMLQLIQQNEERENRQNNNPPEVPPIFEPQENRRAYLNVDLPPIFSESGVRLGDGLLNRLNRNFNEEERRRERYEAAERRQEEFNRKMKEAEELKKQEEMKRKAEEEMKRKADEEMKKKAAAEEIPVAPEQSEEIPVAGTFDLSKIDLEQYRKKIKRMKKAELQLEAETLGVDYDDKDVKQVLIEKISEKIAKSGSEPKTKSKSKSKK